MSEDLQSLQITLDYALRTQLTPRQRSEISELWLLINEDHSSDYVEISRQRSLIEAHHEALKGSLHKAYFRMCCMTELAHTIWFMTAADYDCAENGLDCAPFPHYIKVYGDEQQRKEAFAAFSVYVKTDVDVFLTDLVDDTMYEMLVVKDIFVRRAKAVCNNLSLVAELNASENWKELKAVLIADRETIDDLTRYIRLSDFFTQEYIRERQRLLFQQIDRLLELVNKLIADPSLIVDAAERNDVKKKRSKRESLGRLFAAMRPGAKSLNYEKLGDNDSVRSLLRSSQSEKDM